MQVCTSCIGLSVIRSATCLGLGGLILGAATLGATDSPTKEQTIEQTVQATAAEQPKPDAAQPAEPVDLGQLVNRELNLTASQIIQLDVDRTPTQPVMLAISIDGQPRTLSMTPHSVRSAIYQLRAQIEDGSIVQLPPGPVRTLRGEILEEPGSMAAGSLMEDGLNATIIMPNGRKLWLEPLESRFADAAGMYVLYDNVDVIPSGGICGVDDALVGPHQHQDADDGGIAGGTTECTDIACDADFAYYQSLGSNSAAVESQINNIINTINLQYESEVQIRHVITDIIIRTAEPDPYSSTDPGTLLCQFRAEWNANQTGIQRDVAHLFTGLNIDDPVVGIAYPATVCNVSQSHCGFSANSAYSLAQPTCCGSFACKSDLTAHELGHNWDATHCDCINTTMFASLQCANTFAAVSVNEIVAFRNTRACIGLCEDGTATLPFFDDFPTTTIDPAKWTGIDGATSNSIGLAEPSPPNSVNLDGSTNGGDEIRSAIINTQSVVTLTLQYYYQRRGGGDSPEANDDLVIEYLNSAGDWIELHRQLGSGADMTTYEQVTTDLPIPGANHADFRFRFRAISLQSGLDDWFVDNVSLTGIVTPSNNNCINATNVVAGSTPFTTIAATTDGPTSATCNFNGYNDLENDVWFRYVAECTGTVTASLCGADFNSKMAVYGSNCPIPGSFVIACSDDNCADDPTVSFPMTQNGVVRIRVGGFQGQTGTGTLVISCEVPAPDCPADIAPPGGDNQVNVTDLLAVIGGWGACGDPDNCPADIAPPGGDDVVNIEDLLEVIASWGSCP
ncbi:MAG: M12 family metallo-peptidase [Phycisphaerales bacterium]|nr:M12 family metallo-peptidase [Phycisphaerales bacterium]MCI0675494.1 M12 family metallo-peptidase [Phycisphaerales bacterium]